LLTRIGPKPGLDVLERLNPEAVPHQEKKEHLMKIHEYQAKAILREYGVRTPQGELAETPAQARSIAEKMGAFPVVVKSQVLVGGRGKAGGIKLAKSAEEAEQHASSIIGMDIKGENVKSVLIE